MVCRFETESGASEVIGAILLAALSMIAISSVAVIILTGSGSEAVPEVDIMMGLYGDDDSGTLAIYNSGGDSLRTGEYMVYIDFGNGPEDYTDQICFSPEDDGFWSPGDYLIYQYAKPKIPLEASIAYTGSGEISLLGTVPLSSTETNYDSLIDASYADTMLVNLTCNCNDRIKIVDLVEKKPADVEIVNDAFKDVYNVDISNIPALTTGSTYYYMLWIDSSGALVDQQSFNRVSIAVNVNNTDLQYKIKSADLMIYNIDDTGARSGTPFSSLVNTGHNENGDYVETSKIYFAKMSDQLSDSGVYVYLIDNEGASDIDGGFEQFMWTHYINSVTANINGYNQNSLPTYTYRMVCAVVGYGENDEIIYSDAIKFNVVARYAGLYNSRGQRINSFINGDEQYTASYPPRPVYSNNRWHAEGY